ncbi:MAG: FKBP-type peptidyl-prolyl cis-trans isomerase [Chloroflexota bacterium]
MKTIKMWLITVFILTLTITACSSKDIDETAEPIVNTAAPEISSEITVEDPLTLEGAIVTDSGLQYLEIAAGDGESPQVGDIIRMHFIGTLPDGLEFGNSYQMGDPIEVVWGREQLLPGWEEGIGLMKTGGEAKLVIPPELGFGDKSFGVVPANSSIIIEMELISVEHPPASADVKTQDLTTSESGLQHFDIIEGNGDEAIYQSNVKTHYSIWIQGEDENIFIASSYSADPVPFVLGRADNVFPGWDEGVHGMKEGGKRLLIIPPDLALGEEASSGIPANSTLIMEIELVEVIQPETITEIDDDAYTTSDSSLKYYDIKDGQGNAAEAGQTVVVHYTGWLEDGTQFDSSWEFGQPFTFELGSGQVIAGWDEGVAGMQINGIRQLVIPAELGYGATGAGDIIPPDATLIFRVQLIEIQE